MKMNMRRMNVLAGVALLLSLPALDARAALVGRWTFDTDFSDSSGNNLHGTSSGTATAGVTGMGREGGVLQLDGAANSFVDVLDNDLLDLPNTFTIAAWVKTSAYPEGSGATTVGQANFVRKLNTDESGGTGTEVYSLRLNNNNAGTTTNLRFHVQGPPNDQLAQVQNTAGGPVSNPFFKDVWVFVAATYDGAAAVPTVSLYRGTNLAPRVSTSGAPIGPAPRATTDVLRIGSGSDGGGFNGFIDDVWIFNHALTDDEVAAVRTGTYVLPTLDGDYNHNGHVDAADYVVWRKTMSGDQNAYNVWRANFGLPAGSGAALGGAGLAQVAVPEPGAALYVVWSCLSILGWRRRSRCHRK